MESRGNDTERSAIAGIAVGVIPIALPLEPARGRGTQACAPACQPADAHAKQQRRNRESGAADIASAAAAQARCLVERARSFAGDEPPATPYHSVSTPSTNPKRRT